MKPAHIADPINDDTDPSILLSPQTYNTGLLGSVDPYPIQDQSWPFWVIFDSGASLTISPYKDNFIEAIKTFPTEQGLGEMANSMLIQGIGLVKWALKTNRDILVVTS